MSSIEDIEEKRAQRRNERKAQFDEQRAKDLAAQLDLEIEHGEEHVVRVDIKESAYTPGLPTLVLMRTCSGPEFKRFQDTSKERGGKAGDPLGATNQIAACCRLCPDGDVYKQLLDVMPGIHVTAGTAVLKRVQGEEAEEGKG